MLTGRGEEGFTLVELMVAVTIMLLVAGALLTALESGTTAERRASTRIDDEQGVQLVLAQLARDGRESTAVLAGSGADELDLTVGASHVRWVYQGPSRFELVREVVDDQTSTVTPGVSVGDLGNGTVPVFTLRADDGSDLSQLPPADQLHCATTIEATVVSLGHKPLAPFTESTAAPVAAGADHRGCP